MNGRRLINRTLRANALFSLLSGVDLVVFDQAIMVFLTGAKGAGLWPTGIMLICFSGFVFAVSMLKAVNKYLVGLIIAMDIMWVIGSAGIVIAAGSLLTLTGMVLILAVALIIGLFAYFQTKGLLRHLAAA